MAQTDILVNRVIRDVIFVNSSATYFDGRKVFADDSNYILLDVNSESSGGKQVGVAMQLTYKNPVTNVRIYTGEYNGKRYIMTCNTTNVNRVTFTVTVEEGGGGELSIEYFPATEVFKSHVGVLNLSTDNAWCITVIGGKLAHFALYCSSTVSQPSMGWKPMVDVLSTWKYKIDTSKGSCRGVGSLYTSNGYVNSAMQITSGSPNEVYGYYTSAAQNQTGGFNIDIWANVTLR